MKSIRRAALVGLACLISLCPVQVSAHSYREAGKSVKVSGSALSVKPPRDWNKLSAKPGKYAETWALDGEQLNDVTFFNGVEPGNPLVKERNKKNEPLPKFTADLLAIEIPELLEKTYRTYKKIGGFSLTNSQPQRLLGREGIVFSYDYTDQDELPRKGEARAVIISKKLYMITFEAPRLHYFERTIEDFRALADTAALQE